MKVATVRYDDFGQMYDFLTDIEDLKKGDQVVVESSRGLGIATVQAIKNHSAKATKWVVQRVDLEAHNERIEREEKLKELRAKMEKRYKEISEIALFEKLASEDDDMKILVDEFKSLKKRTKGEVY